jgi:hypothetical protein
MPERSRKKRRTDLNQLAKLITDEATSQPKPEGSVEPDYGGKNPAAVELGRLGGLIGGKARAKKMTKKQRSEAARKAAKVRWRKKTK